MKTVFDIIEVESGIWVLEEDGKNVFTLDCHRFGIAKNEKKALYRSLLAVAETIQEGSSLKPHIEKGILKKLEQQPKGRDNSLWEIRDEGWGSRLIFVLESPNLIIVSAVSKYKGSLSQAVNRGANRWMTFLSQKRK